MKYSPEYFESGAAAPEMLDGRLEAELLAEGHTYVAGVDEAGRGPLAGPVVAAAVILPFPCPIDGIDDSKRLSASWRLALFEEIRAAAVSFSTGIASVEMIDRVNILEATRWAMHEAVAALSPLPHVVLVDAVTIPGLHCPQRPLIHGDRLCLSIAAASIIAKVTRDRLLDSLHEEYPEYGFREHKGYGTRAHLAAIARYGVCPAHRRSFAPVRNRMLQGSLFDLDGDS